MDLPERLLPDLLRAFEEEYPNPTAAGTWVEGDVTWRWTAEAVEVPSCEQCDARLDMGHDGSVSCTGCARPPHTWRVPAALRRAVKTAALVIGGEEDQRRPEVHLKPVTLACPACGGGLSIGQDRERISSCDFCGSQVHLPDAVWRQLHPPREVKPWSIRFEGEGAAASRAHARQQDAIQKRKKAEKRRQQKQAKAAARKEREAEQAAEKAAREEARRATTRRRRITGTVAIVLSAVLIVGSSATMLAAIGAYFIPNLYGMLGLGKAAGAMLNTALLATGAVMFLISWLAGHVAVAWRSELPVISTVGFSLLVCGMLVIPGVGMFSGLALGWLYASGRFPTPSGEKYRRWRHPFPTTLPLAALLLVGGLFFSVASALLLDMTIWELLQAMSD